MPKPGIHKDCLRSMGDNDLLITLREMKATIVATMGVSVSRQLIRMVSKTLEYNRKKRVLVQPRPFSTEIATTTKILKSHYRYEAEGRGFVFFSSR
jgi:hypothetical protein